MAREPKPLNGDIRDIIPVKMIRYYHRHLLIACLISVATLSPTGGAMFYVGREVRDREKIGDWDWRGLWWPVVGLSPLWVAEITLKIGMLILWLT